MSMTDGGGDTLLIRYGTFLFRYRNAVFPAAMVLVLLSFRPVLPFGDAAADRWLDGLGLLIILIGQGVRAAVIGLAYIKRGGVNKKIHADALVRDGIFAHARNPLYVGNLLILGGLFVIHNNPWVYLLGGTFFLVSYGAIVAAEEEYLAAKFGDDYADYCRKVGRWLPTLRGLGRTLRSMSFNWRRVIMKDYSTVHTWSTTVLGLVAYQIVVERGFAARPALLVIAVAVVALALAALGVRALKKSGRLHDRPMGQGS
ncbi:MAG TPA: isoprenylcysteine carboxylmethyltransferase family protein [Kiloniellales bacterium]